MVQALNNQSILMSKVVLGYQDLGNSFAIFKRESEDREHALYSQLKSVTQIVEQLGHKQKEFIVHSEERLSSYCTSVDNTSPPLLRRSGNIFDSATAATDVLSFLLFVIYYYL
jgi:hypothetical protein